MIDKKCFGASNRTKNLNAHTLQMGKESHQEAPQPILRGAKKMLMLLLRGWKKTKQSHSQAFFPLKYPKNILGKPCL